MAKKTTKKTLSDKALVTRLSQDALDDMVHQEFSKRAADVNNEGKIAQINCLLQSGWTVEEITQGADV